MNNTTNQIKPLSSKDRIAYLDILRGIAILFIFSANIVFFSGMYFTPEETLKAFPTAVIDEILDFIMYTLVDGKFYSIFSLLFGIGFVVQYNNLKKNNRPFVPFFSKRMFWLLVIGLIHIHIWVGDILTLYAILGFVLILFRNKSNKQLIIWAIILILFPIVHMAFIALTGWFYPGFLFQIYDSHWQSLGLPMIDIGGGRFRSDQFHYFSIENIELFFKANYKRPLIRLALILAEGRIFKVLGIFIIGIWAGRKILNENILTNTQLLKKIALYGFLIGLPFSIFRTIIEFYLDQNGIWGLLHTVSYAFGTVPLAMAYAASIALICQNKDTWLKWFTPVGKTALSNYIFQSIIAIGVFQAFGLGMAGKIGFTGLMAIVIFIFILQNWLSKLWLSKFKFGPLEWIWRQLTYGKIMSIRK